MDDANFASQIPGNAQPKMASWIDNYVAEGSPEALIEDLSDDGFGFVLKVLREIKTSWKLFLNEMEGFLEDLVRPPHGCEFAMHVAVTLSWVTN
jgi:hypothetical protein